MIDPRPRAVPGPLLTFPRQTQLQTEDVGDAVQDFTEAKDIPSNYKSFATPDNGIGTNTNYDFYTVPANKNLVVTSCKVSENTTTAANIQFVSLSEIGGAGKVANAYIYGGATVELIQTPITFGAGKTVRLKTGGAVTPTIAQLTGYLIDATVTPGTAPPPQKVQISEFPIG